MRCPICSTENEENTHECIACGYPFIIEEEELESWGKPSDFSEDNTNIDGYGQVISDGDETEPEETVSEEEKPDTQEKLPEETESVQEEVRQDEKGQVVSVITVTMSPEPHTIANTEYDLHTESLFDTLPEQIVPEEGEPGQEKEKVGSQVVRAIKAPITARETTMLIAMLLMGVLLLATLGYFLVSGKFAQSLRNYKELAQLKETATEASVEQLPTGESGEEDTLVATETEDRTGTEEETEPAVTKENTDGETEESASEEETEESSKEEEQSTEETEEGTEEEESEPIEEQPDGTILYDDAFVLVEAGEGYELVSYTGTDSIAILPESCQGKPITVIRDNAFVNRTDVTQVQIPEGVTTIGNAAFYNCTGLQALALPDSLTGMGNNVFDYTGQFVIISHAGTYAQQYCMQMGVLWAQGAGLSEDGSVPEGTMLQAQP